MSGAAALNVLAKASFQRSRPTLWPGPLTETDYGFPSGHAMGSSAVVVAMIMLLWPTRGRWPALVVGVPFLLAVGVSRLYLGVHYPSDILAGWCAALPWVVGTRRLLAATLPPLSVRRRSMSVARADHRG